VQAALAQSFPRLAQSIAALPAVTGGWSDVPGTAHLTRFDGSPVRTVPQVRDYFAKDVIPVLERQRANFQRLETEPPDLNFIPPLLTAVGVLAILFGLGMILVFRPREDRGWEVPIAWSVVVAVGGLVLAFVFGARLYPSLDGGQKVLDDAHPAFTDERVAGDRAGITIVSQVVDLADPIVTRQGGAAAEVPKLLAFVSQKTGLSQAQVLQALQQNFPHTTALLQAVPLEDVTRELPRLVAFLSDKLGLSEAQVQAALAQSFPRLAQSIAALPAVTGGWSDVPGTAHLTRFDGSRCGRSRRCATTSRRT